MAERILVMRCKDCGTRVGEPHRDVPHTGGLYYPNLENHPAVMKPEPADPEPRAYCDDVEGEPDLRDEFAKRWDAEMAPVKRSTPRRSKDGGVIGAFCCVPVKREGAAIQYDDGVSLISASHPQRKPWWRRLLGAIFIQIPRPMPYVRRQWKDHI